MSERNDGGTTAILNRARAIWDRARAWFSAAPKPLRILVISTAVAALLAFGYVTWQSQNEPYAPLYTELDKEDAAAVVAKLKEMKVPYRLSQSGTTVEIPTSRVQETRLELAAAGLPHGGGVGFESLDKMRLGATDFEQKVLYRRALEGELGRTVASLSAVESARVHLVMPEKSVFVSRRDPASASIMVKLRPGKALGQDEIAGVVNLVASSVPGLSPEQIALVTTSGQMLHRPRRSASEEALMGGGGGAGADEDALLMRQANEASLEDRVRQMLERVVGPGHADVRVSLELDSARVEHVEDHYDPTKTAIRSSDETVERTSDSNGGAAGVPGAESNTPQGTAPATAGGPGGPNVIRQSTTRNFEIDHVSEKRTQLGGGVKRMTVAVVLDGVPSPEDKAKMIPRSEKDVAMVRALVAAAVGTDDKRGDVVTVESVPFVEEPMLEASAAPAATSPVDLLPKSRNGRIGVAVGAAVLLLVAVVAMRRRQKRVLAEKKAKELAELEAAESAKKTAPVLETTTSIADLPEMSDPREEAIALASRDSATAAIVLRAWLGAQESSSQSAA